ncbi:taurine transport system permease protein [Haloactinopolyspora alba]|uniref:Taurine transport system permease protein n=1 Tax=Haloactinopolyspora alba TaxID=648780 RepID=A0A2P8E067_9ACTN|nr:ABC transporter permease [Haloactinopolyspora alba]PSL02839.1 taurine transport system permease protein [Haloactinopolyspora alba]
MTGRRTAAIGAVSVLVAIGVWYLATERLELVSPLALPSPVAVADRLVALHDTAYLGETIWGHTLASIQVMFAGWLLAGVVGVPLGVAMAWSTPVRRLVYPTFQLLRSISPIAWIPLAIIWLGIASSARIFIVFIAAVVPWVVSSMDGVTGVNPLLIKAARTLGAGRRTMTDVVLPASLPSLLAGARIAMGNAWTAIIAAELLAATAGLGFVALNSSRTLDTPTLLAAMAVIGLLGMLLSYALQWLSAVLAPWARKA